MAIIFDDNLLKLIAADPEKRYQLYKLVGDQTYLLDHPAFREVILQDVANELINERKDVNENSPKIVKTKKTDIPTISDREFWKRANYAIEVLGGEVRDFSWRVYGTRRLFVIPFIERHNFLTNIEKLVYEKLAAVKNEPMQEKIVASRETTTKKRRVRVPKHLRYSWRMQAYEILTNGTVTNPIKVMALSEAVRARMDNEGFDEYHTRNALRSKTAWGNETSFLHNMVYRINVGKGNRVSVVSFAPPEYIRLYGCYDGITREILDDIKLERRDWLV